MKLNLRNKLLLGICILLFTWVNVAQAACTGWLLIYEFSSMTYTDSDEDFYVDSSELINWTDPCIANDRFYVDETGDNWVDPTWNTWDYIEISIPWNLRSIDTEESGFIAFDTWWSLNVYDHWTPSDTDTWYWLNNSQDLSRIIWRTTPWDHNSPINLSSTWTLTWALAIITNYNFGPHRMSIFVDTDTHHQYLFLKIVDFLYWDPDLDYTTYIYIWKLHVDVTKPICSIILDWFAHEQRTESWLENEWFWGGSWTREMLSLTWVAKDISVYTWAKFGPNWTFITENNPTVSILNREQWYTWNFIRTYTWYIPWSRSGININELYKDNLSWLESSIHYIPQNNLLGYTFNDTETILSTINKVLATADGVLKYEINKPFEEYNFYLLGGADANLNNLRIHAKVTDISWNTNVCSSQISKVDVDYPSLVFSKFYDYLWWEAWQSWVWELPTNKWFSIAVKLTDAKSCRNSNETDCLAELAEWVSSFRPSDFNAETATLYYCWRGLPWACIYENRNSDEGIYLSWTWMDEFIYSSTWTHSSGVFISWIWDLKVPSWFFIEKDAYFTWSKVLCDPLWSQSNCIFSSSWSTEEILVSRSWTYLSDEKWFWKINNPIPAEYKLNTPFDEKSLRWNKFTTSKYSNGYFFETWAMLTWTIAFKVYSIDPPDWPLASDVFYPTFTLVDRAWNLRRQSFEMRRRKLARILGNVQIRAEHFVVDPTVQEFYENKQTLVENIAAVKERIKYEISNAKADSGVYLIDHLDDLDQFKFDIWDERIYAIRQWTFIFDKWIIELDADGDDITIVTYWGNIIVNSTYLSSNSNLALVAFKDPQFKKMGSVDVSAESQGNILISPDTLVIRSHLVSEWSIMSYAYMAAAERIEIVFEFNSRRSIFKNQLIVDWLLMSHNTLWWYSKKICPETLYGRNNDCGTSETEAIEALMYMYDLHYLRVNFDDSNELTQYTPIPLETYHLVYKTKGRFAEIVDKVKDGWFIDSFTGVVTGVPVAHRRTFFDLDALTHPPSLNVLERLDPAEFSDSPVLIKNVVPNYSMKIFGGKSQ